MSDLPNRVILIGWDGAPPEMVESMVDEGKLPHVAEVMKRGSTFHALNPYPTITASNWTTIATGAWPGRHSVTGYSVHHPGEPLNRLHIGFNTEECAVEHIWEAAERAGKRSILVKYETAWPPTIRNGIVIGGCGPDWSDEVHRISDDVLFATESGPGLTSVDLKKVGGGCYQANLDFPVWNGDPKQYFLKIENGRAVVTKPDGSVMADLAPGEWSGDIKDTFRIEGKEQTGVFRFRLYSLPETERGFWLHLTSITPETGWTYPDELGPELMKELGWFSQRGPWGRGLRGMDDSEAYIDMQVYQNDWLAGAVEYLTSREPWDILFLQTHTQDYAHHMWMRSYDPLTAGSIGADQRYYQAIMERLYQSADDLLGRTLACVDDDTLVIVVSDHGATTWFSNVNVNAILRDAGLFVSSDEGDPDIWVLKMENVIWKKTKVYHQRSCHIYLNVKGRDPDGIVEPGREYEKLCQQVRELLYGYHDPGTGECPFAAVFTREEARVLGLYGPRVGDIVFAFRQGYGHEHGQQLPSAHLGRGSQEAFLTIAGPGIKKGAHFTDTMVGLQDVVPTICYLMDLPIPNGCEGAVIYDALADRDLKVKQAAALRR